MKKAYFVVGPESAGNRMMAKALVTAKDFGDGGIRTKDYDDGRMAYEWDVKWAKRSETEQSVDEILEGIPTAPDEIVLMMSVPRKGWPNKEWIPIGKICNVMQRAGYKVYPIVMSRFWKYVAQSQVNRGHVPDFETASEYVRRAYRHILDEMELYHRQYFLVEYEDFVTKPQYRKATLEMLDIDGEPQMEFFNANEKYR